MMRSGLLASATAEPSFRNSGLEQTSKGWSRPCCTIPSAMRSVTASAVPTGTVDLLITTFRPLMCSAMPSATLIRYCRSGLSSSRGGVPTQINRNSLLSTEVFVSVVKVSSPPWTPRITISLRPGSKKGTSPRCSRSTRSASMSIQITR